MAVRGRAVTRIGWVGLGLSILALLLQFATGWAFTLGLQNAPGVGQIASSLFPWILITTLVAIIAASVVDLVAGTGGRGNRIVGIIGGVLMLGPALFIGIAILLSPH